MMKLAPLTAVETGIVEEKGLVVVVGLVVVAGAFVVESGFVVVVVMEATEVRQDFAPEALHMAV